MTLTIDSELERRVVDTARKRGLAPEIFVREVLTRETGSEHPLVSPSLSVEEFLAELSRIGNQLPELPDHAYTRESFYEDHP